MGRLAWCDLGRVGYVTARRVQEQLASRRIRGEAPDALLLLEHPPIVTVGRSFGRSPGSRDTAAGLAGLAATWMRVDRGGGPTFHGPGQLVVYPVVALRSGGVRSFVCALERALCDVAREFGVAASHRADLPGAWVRRAGAWRKVASIGLAVRRGVTLHGATVNVSASAEAGFAGFAPCGIEGAVATSIETETGRVPPPLPEVASVLARALAARAGFSGAELLAAGALGIEDLATVAEEGSGAGAWT